MFDKSLPWPKISLKLLEMLERPTVRRFQRVPTHLQVDTESDDRTVPELTEEIARGGFRLRSKRELFPDIVERYQIKLPEPLTPISVEGQIVSRLTVPGDASILAGVRILSFLDGEEADWIQLTETLLREASMKDESPAT